MPKDDLGPGVWRTVGGRRIFIKDGQDLSTAMRESGKFNNIIKETPSCKYNDDVSFICKIRGVSEIEKEYGVLKNKDVVLTDERRLHILEQRGKKDYRIVMKNMSDTIKNYDYLFDNTSGKKKGVTFIKKISPNSYVSVHVSLSLNKKEYANSNITGYVMGEKSFKRFRNKRKIIAKKK